MFSLPATDARYDRVVQLTLQLVQKVHRLFMAVVRRRGIPVGAGALVGVLWWPDNEPFHEALPRTLIIHVSQARIIPWLLTEDLLVIIFVTLCYRMRSGSLLGPLSLRSLSLSLFYI